MKGKVTGIPLLASIGQKYDKNPAQITLRWCLQKGVVAIPKSAHLDRISSNARIFDFSLSPEEMAAIDRLDRQQRVGPDPDNFNF